MALGKEAEEKARLAEKEAEREAREAAREAAEKEKVIAAEKMEAQAKHAEQIQAVQQAAAQAQVQSVEQQCREEREKREAALTQVHELENQLLEMRLRGDGLREQLERVQEQLKEQVAATEEQERLVEKGEDHVSELQRRIEDYKDNVASKEKVCSRQRCSTHTAALSHHSPLTPLPPFPSLPLYQVIDKWERRYAALEALDADKARVIKEVSEKLEGVESDLVVAKEAHQSDKAVWEGERKQYVVRLQAHEGELERTRAQQSMRDTLASAIMHTAANDSQRGDSVHFWQSRTLKWRKNPTLQAAMKAEGGVAVVSVGPNGEPLPPPPPGPPPPGQGPDMFADLPPDSFSQLPFRQAAGRQTPAYQPQLLRSPSSVTTSIRRHHLRLRRHNLYLSMAMKRPTFRRRRHGPLPRRSARRRSRALEGRARSRRALSRRRAGYGRVMCSMASGGMGRRWWIRRRGRRGRWR